MSNSGNFIKPKKYAEFILADILIIAQIIQLE
jgi:hypothetical protein